MAFNSGFIISWLKNITFDTTIPFNGWYDFIITSPLTYNRAMVFTTTASSAITSTIFYQDIRIQGTLHNVHPVNPVSSPSLRFVCLFGY